MAYTTIDDPSAHFQAKIYTGNGTNSTSYTFDGNSDLQPDLLWFKSRSASGHHQVIDSTRGVNTWLGSNDNSAQGTNPSEGYLASLNSDGWTSADGSSGTHPNRNNNQNTVTYVAWGWKANGGTRTTNTESGNNPAGGYQANTTAGFSIVDYTGTGGAGTMAHGLGVVPQMIIVKERDNTQSWYIYHHTLGNNSELYLNTNEASASPAKWNSTTPTSTVFSLAANDGVNQDATGYITYCFAPIQGYSKFGSYTGNGNADGVFVYTGFAPAWVIQKRTNSSTDAHWHIFDIKRNTYNPRNTRLEGNNAFGDSTGEGMDFVSNGFKLRSNDVRYNGSDDTYIYMAFAEHPFVSSEGVPCTAR